MKKPAKQNARKAPSPAAAQADYATSESPGGRSILASALLTTAPMSRDGQDAQSATHLG